MKSKILMGNSFIFLFCATLTCGIYQTIAKHIDIDDVLEEKLQPLLSEIDNSENYEILQIWHRNITLNNEEGREIRYKRFGEIITRKLKRSSVVYTKTPIWWAYSDTLKRIDEDIILDALALYEDPLHGDSFTFRVDDRGHTYFVGRLHEKNIIPISRKVIRSLQKNKNNSFPEFSTKPEFNDEFGDFIVSDFHVLYTPKSVENAKILPPPIKNFNVFKETEKFHNGTDNRSKRSIPDVIYPRILLVLDYNERYLQISEYQFLHLLLYTISFWNSVNLRFQNHTNPEVQLRLVGIIMSMSRDAIPFIKNNIVNTGLETRDVFRSAREWANSKVSISHDILMIQTNLELSLHGDRGTIVGITSIESNDRDSRKLISIIHDEIDYSGIFPAVHEIGYLNFGDEDNWQDTEDRILDQGKLIEKEILPGTYSTVKEQCERNGYDEPCDSSNICEHFLCRDEHGICEDVGPAYDGTPCVGGQCENGKCIVIAN